jgi:hypothetical protein
MKVKELIKELNKIKDKDRNLQILCGDEDRDYEGCEIFELMHTDENEQCVEIFMHRKNVYII